MLKDKLQPFITRSEEITNLLMSPDITSDIKRMTTLSKEQSSIEPIVRKAKEYIKVLEDIEEIDDILNGWLPTINFSKDQICCILINVQ